MKILTNAWTFFLVHSEPAQDFSSIIESLIPDGEKELFKRQQQTKGK